MSEAAAPAAPAAPTSPAAPVEGQPAQVEAVDPHAEFDALLKAKAVKYKSGGKDKPVQSFKELLRKAEQADGSQSKLQELAERERKASAIEERDNRLRSAKTPRERVAILREYVGEGFDEAAEEAVMERIQREKSLSHLSPAERAAREEAEQYKAKLEQYEAEKAEREESEKTAKEKAEDDALANELATHTVRALQAAKLPKEAAPDATRRLAILMGRASQLGYNLDPAELAQEAVRWAGEDLRAYTAGIDGDALFDFLGEDVVRKASKALVGRANAGRLGNAPPPQPQTRTQPVQGERRSAMAEWRALMGGK